MTSSDADAPCLPVVNEDKIVEQGSECHGFSTSDEVSKTDVLDVTLAEVLLVVLFVSSVVLRQVKTCAAEVEDVSSLTPAFNLGPSLPPRQTIPQGPPPWPAPELRHGV